MSKLKKCDVFTPIEIANRMRKYLHSTGSLLEPSVGEGNLIKDSQNFDKIDVFDIEQTYLNKIHHQNNIRKYNTDFLTYDFKEEKYDNIIMNPPFIRIQDLDQDYRKFIKSEYKLLSKGNIDIYLAFILKSLTLLHDEGICVSINPNSILYNSSCKPIMRYLIENRFIHSIIDYKSEIIFDKINVYCCIMIFNKSPKLDLIYNDTIIQYNDIIGSDSIFKSITDKPKLGSIIDTYNGIATLADRVFIHPKKLYDEPCWKEIFKVSKNIINYIIFPYENNVIIEEKRFSEDNPHTYQFLINNKAILSNRDKGKKTYETWYAFGRKQGLKIFNENVLFIPTMGNIDFPIYEKQFMLFYSGICIKPKNQLVKLSIIKDHISKKNNKEAMFQISSKRGSDWMNISSTNIKDISL